MKFHPKERVLLKDNEGGWYLIPQELAKEFRSQQAFLGSLTAYSEVWYEHIADFDNEFLQYGIDTPDGLYTTGKSFFWENE